MSVLSRCAGLPLAAAALVALSFAAQAADPTPPRKGNVLSLGQNKATGKLLTRNELRECLAQEVRVKAMSEEAVALQRAVETDKTEIARHAEELKGTLETLDRTSKEAVDAFNARGAEQERRIDAYNQRLPAFNAKVEAMQAERADFLKNCADRPYDEGDYFAIKRGK
jgi:hypothetical protein